MDQDQLLEWIKRNKEVVVLVVGGVGSLLIGANEWRKAQVPVAEVEIIDASEDEDQVIGDVLVDITGAVNKPGVYRFPIGARVGEAIEAAGGFSEEANQPWVAKNVNLAQPLVDGGKVYIPFIDETADSQNDNSTNVAGLQSISVNSATINQLTELWGIGEARAQAIIDNRPYQTIDEVKEKANIPSNVWEQIKDEISL